MSGMMKDEVHSRTELTAVDLHDAGTHTVCQCRLQCRRRDFVLNLVTACGHPWSKVWSGLDMHTKFQRRPLRNLRLACSRATVGPSSCSPLMSGRSGSAVICVFVANPSTCTQQASPQDDTPFKSVKIT